MQVKTSRLVYKLVIPSVLSSGHIIVVVMLDIVAQCVWTIVWTLLLFLLCWTYKIINKIKNNQMIDARQESMKKYDVMSERL